MTLTSILNLDNVLPSIHSECEKYIETYFHQDFNVLKNSHQCQQGTGAETGAGNDEGLEIVASVVLMASVLSISG